MSDQRLRGFEAGFTFMELIVVIALLGFLVTPLLVALQGGGFRTRRMNCYTASGACSAQSRQDCKASSSDPARGIIRASAQCRMQACDLDEARDMTSAMLPYVSR